MLAITILAPLPVPEWIGLCSRYTYHSLNRPETLDDPEMCGHFVIPPVSGPSAPRVCAARVCKPGSRASQSDGRPLAKSSVVTARTPTQEPAPAAAVLRGDQGPKAGEVASTEPRRLSLIHISEP